MNKIMIIAGITSSIVGLLLASIGVSVLLDNGSLLPIVIGMVLFVVGLILLFIPYIRNKIEKNKLNSMDTPE